MANKVRIRIKNDEKERPKAEEYEKEGKEARGSKRSVPSVNMYVQPTHPTVTAPIQASDESTTQRQFLWQLLYGKLLLLNRIRMDFSHLRRTRDSRASSTERDCACACRRYGRGLKLETLVFQLRIKRTSSNAAIITHGK